MTLKLNKNIITRGINFRWVVPQLPAEIWNEKQQFKCCLLDKLLSSKTAKKGIKYYSIAIESHADGNPHLDMLLIFEKKIRLKNTELDFLCDKHGNLTRYRSLNQAILDYGSKEDTPISNLPSTSNILLEQSIKKDPYNILEKEMLKNPYNFDVAEYCQQNNLAKHIKNWASIKTKLRDIQIATCNLQLRNKPGIKEITPELIQQELTPSQQEEYHSWDGYQTIVQYINEIKIYGYNRKFKSKQLLLIGQPNTGKTSLNRKLNEFYSTYEIGLTKWFPQYANDTYKLFSWNEFSLNVMPYPVLLKLLEGTYINLEQKGSSVLRTNNQLIIMNSNISLIQHLIMKFGTNSKLVQLKENVKNSRARIHQIEIPKGKTLFLLLKLIKKETEQQ